MNKEPKIATPQTDAIFNLLDKAFLDETGYEHRIALREGARCGVEDLERALVIAQEALRKIQSQCSTAHSHPQYDSVRLAEIVGKVAGEALA